MSSGLLSKLARFLTVWKSIKSASLQSQASRLTWPRTAPATSGLGSKWPRGLEQLYLDTYTASNSHCCRWFFFPRKMTAIRQREGRESVCVRVCQMNPLDLRQFFIWSCLPYGHSWYLDINPLIHFVRHYSSDNGSSICLRCMGKSSRSSLTFSFFYWEKSAWWTCSNPLISTGGHPFCNQTIAFFLTTIHSSSQWTLEMTNVRYQRLILSAGRRHKVITGLRNNISVARFSPNLSPKFGFVLLLLGRPIKCGPKTKGDALGWAECVSHMDIVIAMWTGRGGVFPPSIPMVRGRRDGGGEFYN